MSAGLVIGTAGHIDHGKTSLVAALTGMDTDRLVEEKRRGISIDLGFAHLTLANGQRLSFVDVPGHERFIRNMLAGAAGIEAVLLVIAADESVMPQTREHFEICRLLDIRHGLTVLTKADLATAAQMAKAVEEARSLAAGSFLADAPIIPVSAVTGAGLDELKVQLAMIAAQRSRRDSSGLARLPVDRSFALKGFGTVVTGTLWSGELRIGDTVRIHPTNQEARVRGLQRHGEAVKIAVAGDRTAVNLAGIEHAEIKRGYTLTSLNALETTTMMDVAVDWLKPISTKELLLDIGTAEVAVRLQTFGERFGRLHLTEPVLALPGDRFILRRPSPAMTAAGGAVIDAFPPKRLKRAKTLERLQKLSGSTPAERLELLIDESANGLSITRATQLSGSVPVPTPNMILVNGQHLVSKRWLEERRRKLLEWLKDFHAANPAAVGAPMAQARLGVDAALVGPIFAGFQVQSDVVSLPGHVPQVSSRDTKALAEMEMAFRRAAFQPPEPNEVLAASGLEQRAARGILETLVKNGRLVRISGDMIFHSDVITHIRQSLSGHKGRRFTVIDFKSWTNISRKYAIPLLEYLDQQRVTKRDGDARVVL